MTPDKVEAALGVLRGAVDRISDNEAAPYDEALSVLTEALAESRRDALAAQEILARALDYVGNRSGGGLVKLADRAEHWMRGRKILIDMLMKETQ